MVLSDATSSENTYRSSSQCFQTLQALKTFTIAAHSAFRCYKPENTYTCEKCGINLEIHLYISVSVVP